MNYTLTNSEGIVEYARGTLWDAMRLAGDLDASQDESVVIWEGKKAVAVVWGSIPVDPPGEPRLRDANWIILI
jgi:hypothetical protein